MTELEFKALAAQGYNRIPLIAESFADLETPLSLYLKLANEPQHLPARVGGRRRALRPLFVHRPGRAHVDALVHPRRWRNDRSRRRRRRDADHRRRSARLQCSAIQTSSRWRCGPGCRASAAGWPATSATTRCATSRRSSPHPKPDDIGMPDILLLLTEELAVIDNLSGRST